MTPSGFQRRCEALFSGKLGYGRRWKSAAAEELGIGRATLYRYFESDAAPPADILARLEELEAPARPARNDREMVSLAARALVEVQNIIDQRGWLGAPYPKDLRRFFDLAGARNLADAGERWPTDLFSLTAAAQQPLLHWVPDMSWDLDGEFFGARLIQGGEVTTDARRLAVQGGDPELEIDENLGFEMLVGLCRNRVDGEAVYRAWRRSVITNPVLLNWASTLMVDPALAGLERLDEIVEAFYDPLPESLAIEGSLPVCKLSGTILRRDGRGFHTEHRDPEAIRQARAGAHDRRKFRKGMMYLKRAFRTFWCLPGLTELALERQLTAMGWTAELWPGLDRVDLTATSPSGRRIAVDVKDYFSPSRLAARFTGFKSCEADHDCFLVVPDYVMETDESFSRRFEAFRASVGKAPVELHTLSGFLAEVGSA